MPYFCGAYELVRHRMSYFCGAYTGVPQNAYFMAKILWSTTHAPQNTYIGAPEMRFSLLVWVPSEFSQTDLTKAQTNGLIADGDQIIFPSTERIPKPPSGFRVMFLAFLLRGLSFPAHEFLHGLLFVYGVQLHQLTPNSILHTACFVTLCESFLGIEPHWLLWKFLFRLRPSVALSRKPELGRAIIFARTEVHYLEFTMAASVQGWKKKWFYIKDQKSSSSNHYGIAPFDANQDLKKLSSWDSPPMEAEMEDIKPLLTHI
jgi:hypothetical protein